MMMIPVAVMATMIMRRARPIEVAVVVVMITTMPAVAMMVTVMAIMMVRGHAHDSGENQLQMIWHLIAMLHSFSAHLCSFIVIAIINSHGAEIPSRACALLRHLELKGIAHFLTTSWPSCPDEYWQCDCGEDATDFIKLILSDGADAFLPLMMVVRNFITMLKLGVKTFWAENSSLVNDQEVLSEVLHRTLEVHISVQAQAVACLDHLCKQGVLTEEQKRLFSAVCRQQVAL